MERKTKPVTQLDEDAVCRLMGYTVLSICAAYMSYEQNSWMSEDAEFWFASVPLHFSEA